jgi:hypothetical protein
MGDSEIALILGQFTATIAYGQLVAESAERHAVPPPVVNTIFHLLVQDVSSTALMLASSPKLNLLSKVLIRRLIAIPTTTAVEWEFVAKCGADLAMPVAA